jgi:hypothetical protein
MLGMMGVPKIKTMIKIKGKTMDIDAVEAFMNDLYDNAGVELADDFNPVDEVVKVVIALRKQGQKEVVNET